MGRLFSMDLRIVPPERAVVPVMDRGLLYGDSVYETIRTYRGSVPFLLDRHYRRLLRSAEHLALRIPFSLEALRAHLAECLRKAGNSDSYIRLIVTRGEDDRFALFPAETLTPRTICIIDRIPELPASLYTEGARVALVSVRRNLRSALDPNVKSGNYLNNMLAMMEAKGRGADDAVMLNYQGWVTEGTTSNVFMVKGGTVRTPKMESGILEGTTRALLKEIFTEEKIPFLEAVITAEDFLAADEAFLTGTVKEILPVRKVDDRSIGAGRPGEMTKRIMRLFREKVDAIVRAETA